MTLHNTLDAYMDEIHGRPDNDVKASMHLNPEYRSWCITEMLLPSSVPVWCKGYQDVNPLHLTCKCGYLKDRAQGDLGPGRYVRAS